MCGEGNPRINPTIQPCHTYLHAILTFVSLHTCCIFPPPFFLSSPIALSSLVQKKKHKPFLLRITQESHNRKLNNNNNNNIIYISDISSWPLRRAISISFPLNSYPTGIYHSPLSSILYLPHISSTTALSSPAFH